MELLGPAVFDDRRVLRAALGAEAPPAGPERQREKRADDADDKQDDPNCVEIDARNSRVDSPDQNGTDSRKNNWEWETHWDSLSLKGYRLE